MSIRPATEGDLDDIVELGTRHLDWLYERVTFNGSAVRRAFTAHPDLAHVAETNRTLTGFALGAQQGDHGDLRFGLVAPEHRRQGIGTDLVTTTLTALEPRVDTITANIREEPDVQALYASQDFRTTDRRKLMVTSVVDAELVADPRQRSRLDRAKARWVPALVRRLPTGVTHEVARRWAGRKGDGIREPVPSDVDAIYDIGIALLDWSCETTQFTKGSVRWYVEKQARFCRVAIVDGELVAFALGFVVNDIGFQAWLATRADHQRTGIALPLVQEQTAAFGAAGISELASQSRDIDFFVALFADYGYSPNGQAFIDVERSVRR